MKWVSFGYVFRITSHLSETIKVYCWPAFTVRQKPRITILLFILISPSLSLSRTLENQAIVLRIETVYAAR